MPSAPPPPQSRSVLLVTHSSGDPDPEQVLKDNQKWGNLLAQPGGQGESLGRILGGRAEPPYTGRNPASVTLTEQQLALDSGSTHIPKLDRCSPPPGFTA